jgi:transaldolase
MDQRLNDLKIKIFADGADLQGMIEMNAQPLIQGLTTNPTLMRKAGISDYKKFAKTVLREVSVKPISFEVFSDDLPEMKRQGLEIAGWASNVYVKIPVTTTKGESTAEIVNDLANQGVKLNVTAIMTMDQVQTVYDALVPNTPSYISVFAGRIADTGINPVPIMANALEILRTNVSCELIWASPRELYNLFQADEIGCHIITATNDILKKLEIVGYDLTSYSLDTVKMFYRDALAAGFQL